MTGSIASEILQNMYFYNYGANIDDIIGYNYKIT